MSKTLRLRMKDNIYYIWLGSSCDYQHAERPGGSAYLIEYNHQVFSRYTSKDIHTTEYRMLLSAMINAMETLPPLSEICFLTNVAYLLNFNRPISLQSANPDLIEQCIEIQKRHLSVNIKIMAYHKYPVLKELHQIAHNEMTKIRK